MRADCASRFGACRCAPLSRGFSFGAIMFVTVLTACTSIQVRYPDGSTRQLQRDEFESYVELVFRRYNRVVDDLIVVASLVDEHELEDRELLLAEERAATVCRPLSEIVSARIEGREVGLFHKLQLPEVVPACEAASAALEALTPAL